MTSALPGFTGDASLPVAHELPARLSIAGRGNARQICASSGGEAGKL